MAPFLSEMIKKVLFFQMFSRSFSVTALGFTHSHIVQKSSFFGKDKKGDRVSEAFLGCFWAKNVPKSQDWPGPGRVPPGPAGAVKVTISF